MNLHTFEKTVNWAILVLLGVSVTIATIQLYVLFVQRVGAILGEIDSVTELQERLQRGFGEKLCRAFALAGI